jgi:hypothetical protein
MDSDRANVELRLGPVAEPRERSHLASCLRLTLGDSLRRTKGVESNRAPPDVGSYCGLRCSGLPASRRPSRDTERSNSTHVSDLYRDDLGNDPAL